MRLNAPKKLIIDIAGNKSDLYENEEVDEETAKAFAKVKFIYNFIFSGNKRCF